MATHTSPGETPAVQFEVSVHWSDHRPAVVARLDGSEARELVERLASLAPDEVGAAVSDEGLDTAALLLGLQAFYRLTFQSDGCLALADTDGALWTIPARSVDGVRIRAVAPAAPA